MSAAIINLAEVKINFALCKTTSEQQNGLTSEQRILGVNHNFARK
jgi:hypothetical protein